jgi:hypothetical protein
MLPVPPDQQLLLPHPQDDPFVSAPAPALFLYVI